MKKNRLERALKNIKKYYPFKTGELEYQNIDIIETALKNYEKQDNLIKIIKETIEFGIKDNKVEVSEKGDASLSGTIGLILRKELDKKERILFRDWILETCFPRELKALEIIKRKGIDINALRRANNCAEYNSMAKSCIGYTQEEYDLVNEVLL